MSGESALPMAVEPVAETSGSRASAASCRARSAPPITTSSRPSGASPKAAAARRKSDWQASAVSGVRSLGFQMTGSPHTSASAEFQLQTATGKLKAVITATGPSGCQVSSMRCPGRSEAIVRPKSCRERPTARSQMSIISCTSPRPSWAILPVSSVTSAPSASFSRRSSSPSSRTSSPRRGAGTSRQVSKASAARAIAASVPASSVRWTLASSSPVMGVRTSRSPSARVARSSPSRAEDVVDGVHEMNLRGCAGSGPDDVIVPWPPCAMLGHSADVAQLARASPCHGEGRGFEPLHPLPSRRLSAPGRSARCRGRRAASRRAGRRRRSRSAGRT